MQYPLYKPFLFLLTLTIPVGASQQATPKEKELSANKKPRVPKEASAHVNQQDKYGRTELMLASSEGHTEIVKVLLKRPDIDVNLQDKDGKTALMYASSEGHTEIFKELLKRPDIDVNQQDKDGKIALIYASCTEKLEVVQALLEQKDIDVNLPDDYGMTALIYASCIAKLEVVQALLEQKDIDVNQPDQYGKTALIYASCKGHTEIIEKLLQKKANPNQQDKDGNTMLYHCIEETFTIPENNHQTLLAWLLDTGVKQYGLCPFILNNKNELLQDLYEEDNADSNELFKEASQYLHKQRGCPDFHQQKKNLMIVGRHLARESGCKKTIPPEIDQLIAQFNINHTCSRNQTLCLKKDSQ